MNYILEGKKAVKCDEVLAWAKWYETGDRLVAKTDNGEVRVSTVFLAIDHSFGEGDPLLFETMIFGGEHDEEQWRYSTWEEAEAGHKNACEVARIA